MHSWIAAGSTADIFLVALPIRQSSEQAGRQSGVSIESGHLSHFVARRRRLLRVNVFLLNGGPVYGVLILGTLGDDIDGLV